MFSGWAEKTWRNVGRHAGALFIVTSVAGCADFKNQLASNWGEGGSKKNDDASKELRERDDETMRGPDGSPYAVIGYRGGPNESMVITGCPTCSGSWDQAIYKENGSMSPRPDDPPVTDKVAPAADVDTPPLAPPTWCDGYSGIIKNQSTQLNYEPITKQGEPDAMMATLVEIAWMACDRVHYAPRQRQVVNLLQAWMNVTHMKFARVVPLLALIIRGRDTDAQRDPAKSGDRAVDLLARGCRPIDSSYRPQDQYKSIDELDILEGADKLTELDRAAQICGMYAGPFAVGDLRAVDLDKAQDELIMRMTAKLVDAKSGDLALFGLLDMRFWKPVLLDPKWRYSDINRYHDQYADVAQLTAAEWRNTVGSANKDVLKTAFEAISRARGPLEQAKGCSAVTRPLLEKLVKAKNSKKREDLDAILSDKVGSVVFQADALCNAIDNPLLGAAQIETMSHRANWLGPRRAAWMAAQKLEVPRNGVPIAFSRLQLVPVNVGYPEKRGTKVYEVKSVKAEGEELVVNAAGTRWLDPTYSCYSTNQIERIRPDGYIEYKSDCVQTGSEALKSEYSPMLVPKAYAPFLVKGAIVTMMLADDPAKHTFILDASTAAAKREPVKALPVIVQPNDKKDATLTSYYGIQL